MLNEAMKLNGKGALWAFAAFRRLPRMAIEILAWSGRLRIEKRRGLVGYVNEMTAVPWPVNGECKAAGMANIAAVSERQTPCSKREMVPF